MNLWNRRGDCSSGNGIVEFSKQTLSRLLGHIKVQMILADSGYYQAEFIDYLESIELPDVVATPMIHILQNEIYSIEMGRSRLWSSGRRV